MPLAVTPVLESRRHLLSILPRVLSALSILWKAIHMSEHKKGTTGEDQPRPGISVRQAMLVSRSQTSGRAADSPTPRAPSPIRRGAGRPPR